MASSAKKKRRRALQTESGLRVGMFYAIEVLFDILIILVIIRGFSWGYNFAYDVFNDDVKYAGVTSTKSIVIKADMDYKEVCRVLYENDLIKDKYVLMAKMKLNSCTDRIIPGTYTLKASMSYDTIMGTICEMDPDADIKDSAKKEATDASKTGGTGTEKSDQEGSSEKESSEEKKDDDQESDEEKNDSDENSDEGSGDDDYDDDYDED